MLSKIQFAAARLLMVVSGSIMLIGACQLLMADGDFVPWSDQVIFVLIGLLGITLFLLAYSMEAPE
jgi:hypothetical protein